MALRIASSAPCIDRFCKPIKFFYVNDGVKYFILFDSSYHQLQSSAFFFSLSFPVLRKLGFTETIAIFGGIQRFSRSKKTFSHKLNADSKSAQKTESNEVSLKLIWQLSFFDSYTTISAIGRYLEKWEKMKVVRLTWKILHLTQFFVLITNLSLVCD